MLSKTRTDLRLEAVAEALATTAAYRGTELTLDCAALQPTFALDPRLNQLWKAYARSRALAVPTFPVVISWVQDFVRPIVGAAGETGKPALWDPGSGVWREELSEFI